MGKIGKLEFRQAALARAQDLAGPPETQVLLGNAEAVLRLPHQREPFTPCLRQILAAQKQAYGFPSSPSNAPTKLMKSEGYGSGYEYDHAVAGGVSGQDYFPDEMSERPVFYAPTDHGREAAIRERLERWRALRDERRGR